MPPLEKAPDNNESEAIALTYLGRKIDEMTGDEARAALRDACKTLRWMAAVYQNEVTINEAVHRFKSSSMFSDEVRS